MRNVARVVEMARERGLECAEVGPSHVRIGEWRLEVAGVVDAWDVELMRRCVDGVDSMEVNQPAVVYRLRGRQWMIARMGRFAMLKHELFRTWLRRMSA